MTSHRIQPANGAAADTGKHAARHRAIADRSTAPDRPTRSKAWYAVPATVAVAGLVTTFGATVAFASTSGSPSSASSVIAADAFDRTVQHGIGRADIGGQWSTAMDTSADANVTAGALHVTGVAPGRSVAAWLPSAQAKNVDAVYTLDVPTTSVQAAGTYLSGEVRRQTNGRGYRGKVAFTSSGQLTVSISRVGDASVETPLAYGVTGLTLTAGQTFNLEVKATGSSPSVVSVRAWLPNRTAPNWQVTYSDSSSSQVATAGSVGLWGYRSVSSQLSRWDATSVNATSQDGGAPTPSTPAPSTSASSAPTPAPSTSTASAPTKSSAPTTSAPAPVAPSTSVSTSSAPATTSAPAPSTSAPSTSAPTTSTTPTPPVTSSNGRPGPTNTGVPDGTVLRVVNGNLNITKSGVYSGLDVHGFVRILAPNVTIQNSILRGGQATGDNAIVTDLTGAGTNFVITDSTIVPEFPSVYIDGLDGWNYTATRVDIYGTTDGAKMFGNNATIQDSWIHDLAYWPSDPDHDGGPSHNDAVQILGGHNLTLRHNTLQGGNNSALQVTQTKGSVTNLVFSDNWVSGGACSVNLQDAPLNSMSGISVDHNRFTNDSQYKCAIISFPGVTYVNDANSWVGASGPISTVRRTS